MLIRINNQLDTSNQSKNKGLKHSYHNFSDYNLKREYWNYYVIKCKKSSRFLRANVFHKFFIMIFNNARLEVILANILSKLIEDKR